MCFSLFKKSTPSLEEYVDWVKSQVGDFPIYKIAWSDVVSELSKLGIECMIKDDAPDTDIYYTNEESLTKMVKFLVYPADWYVSSVEKDCDDYAKWASADMSRNFGLCGFQIFGDIKNEQAEGYHAWSMAKTPNGYKMWDANAGFQYAGELFNLGEHNYKSKKWK
jgi:hypothetical protein